MSFHKTLLQPSALKMTVWSVESAQGEIKNYRKTSTYLIFIGTMFIYWVSFIQNWTLSCLSELLFTTMPNIYKNLRDFNSK